MIDQKNLYLGTRGHVVCINKQDGMEVWRTKLRTRGFAITTLLVQDNALYAGSDGFLYALDPLTGDILWENTLPGLRYSVCTLEAG